MPKARRFVAARRDDDLLRSAGADGVGRQGDRFEVVRHAASRHRAGDRGDDSQPEQDGGDLTLQDSRAPSGILQRLEYRDTPAERVQGIAGCRRCASRENALAIGKLLHLRAPIEARAFRVDGRRRLYGRGVLCRAVPSRALQARGPEHHRVRLIDDHGPDAG